MFNSGQEMIDKGSHKENTHFCTVHGPNMGRESEILSKVHCVSGSNNAVMKTNWDLQKGSKVIKQRIRTFQIRLHNKPKRGLKYSGNTKKKPNT